MFACWFGCDSFADWDGLPAVSCVGCGTASCGVVASAGSVTEVLMILGVEIWFVPSTTVSVSAYR